MILEESMLTPGRPALLLDVDGVINLFNQSHNSDRYERHQVGPYPIKFRRTIGSTLLALGEHFTLVWCTMWDDLANTELAPLLGTPAFPYIPCWDNAHECSAESNLHHKVAMIELHMGDHPFAWVDDEITGHDHSWALLRTGKVAPTTLVKTDGRVGLEDHQVNKLMVWANNFQVQR